MLVADQREVTGNGRGKSEMRKKLEAVEKFDVRFITLNISDFCFLRENKGIFLVTLLIEMISSTSPNRTETNRRPGFINQGQTVRRTKEKTKRMCPTGAHPPNLPH